MLGSHRRVRVVAFVFQESTHFRLSAWHSTQSALSEFLLACGLLVLGLGREPLTEEFEVSTACREHAAVGVVDAQKSPPFFDGRIGSLEYHLRPESEDLATVRRFTAFVAVLTWLRPAILVGGNQRLAIRFGVNSPAEVHATIGEQSAFV